MFSAIQISQDQALMWVQPFSLGSVTETISKQNSEENKMIFFHYKKKTAEEKFFSSVNLKESSKGANLSMLPLNGNSIYIHLVMVLQPNLLSAS